MKRLRHIRPSTALQEDQMDNIQKPLPIALTLILTHWDILGVTEFDDLAYEDMVVFLIQHLPKTHDLNDVEQLLLKTFMEQTGSDTFSVEIRLLVKLLADDVFESWRAYLARNNPLAFVQETHARARGLMRRHYYPKADSR